MELGMMLSAWEAILYPIEFLILLAVGGSIVYFIIWRWKR